MVSKIDVYELVNEWNKRIFTPDVFLGKNYIKIGFVVAVDTHWYDEGFSYPYKNVVTSEPCGFNSDMAVFDLFNKLNDAEIGQDIRLGKTSLIVTGFNYKDGVKQVFLRRCNIRSVTYERDDLSKDKAIRAEIEKVALEGCERDLVLFRLKVALSALAILNVVQVLGWI